MPRTPAPPGPPPRHYRPPGSPPPPTPTGPLGRPGPEPSAPPPGIGPGTATAVALVTLLIGVALGFVLGRGVDDGDPTSSPRLTLPSTTTSRPPGDTIPPIAPDTEPGTSAPPGTELAPNRIGSFDDPIPAGQAYILGLYEIEVVGADRDAHPELAAHDQRNPAPPEGHRHVLVELRVRFTDDDQRGFPGDIRFFVGDGTVQWFDFESRCGLVPRSLDDVGVINGGEEVVGHQCFTVPADAVEDLVLGTEGFAGPVYFALPG